MKTVEDNITLVFLKKKKKIKKKIFLHFKIKLEIVYNQKD